MHRTFKEILFMNVIQNNTKYFAVMALAVLMAATRMDHFGSAVTLPDATLAVFYLAGMLAGGVVSFVALCAEAVLIDYLAITQWQVSDYCISPAYAFLLPTHAVMFLAGRWSKKYSVLNIQEMGRFMAYLVGATSLAFLISNGGFYEFSGKFPDMSVAQYIERVVKYYPVYLGSTLLYSVTIALFVTYIGGTYKEKYHTV